MSRGSQPNHVGSHLVARIRVDVALSVEGVVRRSEGEVYGPGSKG